MADARQISGQRRRAPSARAALGRAAEQLVAERLEATGYVVLGRNVRVGRLELDLIAQRDNLLIFCEVRARSHDRLVAPAATMDARKVARTRAAAAQWLKAHSAELGRGCRADVRFDVASVVFDVPGARIEYYEGAY